MNRQATRSLICWLFVHYYPWMWANDAFHGVVWIWSDDWWHTFLENAGRQHKFHNVSLNTWFNTILVSNGFTWLRLHPGDFTSYGPCLLWPGGWCAFSHATCCSIATLALLQARGQSLETRLAKAGGWTRLIAAVTKTCLFTRVIGKTYLGWGSWHHCANGHLLNLFCMFCSQLRATNCQLSPSKRNQLQKKSGKVAKKWDQHRWLCKLFFQICKCVAAEATEALSVVPVVAILMILGWTFHCCVVFVSPLSRVTKPMSKAATNCDVGPQWVPNNNYNCFRVWIACPFKDWNQVTRSAIKVLSNGVCQKNM